MKKRPSLFICLLLDAIGCATYFLPVFGEFGDIVWAPLSALIFYKLFEGKVGLYGGLFNFIEELIPGTDFIPTFTIMWLWNFITREQDKEKMAKKQDRWL